jgi:glutathione S-transferase
MQLISSPASPFVRKVRVLIHEAGLSDRVEEVPVATTAFKSDPQVVAANPLGKIPALTREDGPAIYDSRVITRYLDAQAEGGFYPESRIWEVLTLEATADAIMEACVSMTYEARLRPKAQQSPEWVEAQWTKAARGIAAINARWMSHLAGPLDMAQIAVACALGYVDFRHADRNWRAGNDALVKWDADFQKRDSMVATTLE